MKPLTVLFLSWGNTCRSPMAAVVAREMARQQGLADVTFTSAGVEGKRAGEGMNPLAVAALRQCGYAPGSHTAHRMTAEEIRDASIVIAMQTIQLRKVVEMVPGAHPLYLLSDFDRTARPGTAIQNPTYGDDTAFVTVLHQIEAAMPEVLKRVRERRR